MHKKCTAGKSRGSGQPEHFICWKIFALQQIYIRKQISQKYKKIQNKETEKALMKEADENVGAAAEAITSSNVRAAKSGPDAEPAS